MKYEYRIEEYKDYFHIARKVERLQEKPIQPKKPKWWQSKNSHKHIKSFYDFSVWARICTPNSFGLNPLNFETIEECNTKIKELIAEDNKPPSIYPIIHEYDNN